MRAVRVAAYKYLNFGDGSLPNCLRMAFHDAGTYKNATGEGGSALSLPSCSPRPFHNGCLQDCHQSGLRS